MVQKKLIFFCGNNVQHVLNGFSLDVCRLYIWVKEPVVVERQ